MLRRGLRLRRHHRLRWTGTFLEEEYQEQGHDDQTNADGNAMNTKKELRTPGRRGRKSPSNLRQGGLALVADFLLGGHPDAASGAKMIPLLRMGKVVVTGCAVALAHPYGRFADRALRHKVPPARSQLADRTAMQQRVILGFSRNNASTADSFQYYCHHKRTRSK